MKKRLILPLLALTLVLVGCGGQSRPTVSMFDLRQAMLRAAPALPEMKSVSDSDADAAALFAHLSDLDYGKVEHFFLSYSATGLADEIAVIAVKSTADAESARQSLLAHLDGRAELYRQYKPEQLQRVENAEVFTRDQYAVLIVCDDAAAVKAAFVDFIG